MFFGLFTHHLPFFRSLFSRAKDVCIRSAALAAEGMQVVENESLRG
jgi:hypothetical protein